MSLVFYYLVLPFIASALLIRWLKKHAPSTVPEDVRRLCAERPVEKKWFRSVRRDSGSLRALGDFETRGEAVEAAYRGRQDAQAAGEQAQFVVLDDKGEALEQVDS